MVPKWDFIYKGPKYNKSFWRKIILRFVLVISFHLQIYKWHKFQCNGYIIKCLNLTTNDFPQRTTLVNIWFYGHWPPTKHVFYLISSTRNTDVEPMQEIFCWLELGSSVFLVFVRNTFCVSTRRVATFQNDAVWRRRDAERRRIGRLRKTCR